MPFLLVEVIKVAAKDAASLDFDAFAATADSAPKNAFTETVQFKAWFWVSVWGAEDLGSQPCRLLFVLRAPCRFRVLLSFSILFLVASWGLEIVC